MEQKHTDKPLPSEHEIEQKIIEALRSTITLAKYKYDDNLEDSIFKSGILLSKPAYRSRDKVKHEAESIRSSYEDLTSMDDLLRVSMGKQGLSIVFRWLNDDLHLNICKDDILDALQIYDVPDEIISLFRKLQPETFTDDNLDALPSFLESETVPDTILQDLDIDENDQMQIE